MRYAALVEESVAVDTGWKDTDLTYATYVTVRDFKDQAEMEAWVRDQTTGKFSPRVKFRLIQYEELTFDTTITVKVKRA